MGSWKVFRQMIGKLGSMLDGFFNMVFNSWLGTWIEKLFLVRWVKGFVSKLLRILYSDGYRISFGREELVFGLESVEEFFYLGVGL